MSDYIPNRDSAFIQWMENFSVNVGALALSLSIPPATVTAIATANTTVSDSLDTATQARANAKSATQQKDTDFRNVKSTVRNLVKDLQINPAMNDAYRAQLGITVPSGTRTRVVPKVPQDLIVIPAPNGDVEIRFKRNGNPAGVVFLVYSRTNEGTYQQVAAITGSRETIVGFTPGQMRWFKLVATRNGLTSGFSNEAVIFAPGSEGDTSLKLAA